MQPQRTQGTQRNYLELSDLVGVVGVLVVAAGGVGDEDSLSDFFEAPLDADGELPVPL